MTQKRRFIYELNAAQLKPSCVSAVGLDIAIGWCRDSVSTKAKIDILSYHIKDSNIGKYTVSIRLQKQYPNDSPHIRMENPVTFQYPSLSIEYKKGEYKTLV